MRFKLFLLSVLLSLAVAAPAQADNPGCNNPAKKTLQDPQAALVNLNPVATTIGHLLSLHGTPAPNGPRAGFERTTFTVHATIIFVKFEIDRDFHVVISDGRRTMITEAPDPACAPKSRVLTQMTAVRAAITNRFPTALTTPKGLHVSVPATVTGVGFFDTVHGQFGVAPNGAELHPLTAIQF